MTGEFGNKCLSLKQYILFWIIASFLEWTIGDSFPMIYSRRDAVHGNLFYLLMVLCKAIRTWLCNRVCLCVCVCVTGPGHGHTVWQTAMRNRLVLAHRMKRIPQSSLVTKPFFLEPRGEQMSLYSNTITYLNRKWAKTDSHDVSKQNVLPFPPPTHLPTHSSHTFESLLLI